MDKKIEEDANEIIEIDANDEITNTQYDTEDIPKVENKKNKKPKKNNNFWNKLNKKQKTFIIIGIGVVLLIIILVLIYFAFIKKEDSGDQKDNEPVVISEKDNYRYENGKLIFLDEDKNELGTYKCENKDEDLCYVANYSNEDDFDVPQKIYENDEKIKFRSDIFFDNYVFIHDNKKGNDDVILYDIKEEKTKDTYSLIKKIDDERVIVKKNDAYGMLAFKEDDYSADIKISYDYMGYIEDTEKLVASSNKNYKLIDFNGESVSKNIPGEIKNFDGQNISVKINNDYYVYGYDGKMKIEDEFDYIRFVSNYIIALNGKKLNVYDKDGYKMNGEGIKISSNDYNTKLIFNEELRQIDKQEAFDASLSGDVFKIKFDDETVSINLYEGNFNKSLSYIDYFAGKLYFYSDEEKTKLLGSYACSYANSVNEETEKLENCFLAQESNFFKTDEKLDNGYLPIYNDRYVFIADTKGPNTNDNIILWDLKANKKLATYKAVDTGYHNTENDVNFVSSAGTLVLAKNTSDSYGLINIASNSVNGVIAFKDSETDDTNVSVTVLNDYLVFERSNNQYYLYDKKGRLLTTQSYEIVEYNSNYVKVKANDKYMVYSIDGKILSGDSKYFVMGSGYFINVNSKNVLGAYKTTAPTANLIDKEIVVDEKELSKNLKHSLQNNILTINYVYNNESNIIEVDMN